MTQRYDIKQTAIMKQEREHVPQKQNPHPIIRNLIILQQLPIRDKQYLMDPQLIKSRLSVTGI